MRRVDHLEDAGLVSVQVLGAIYVGELARAEKRAELLETIPVRRFCKPEEVAHAVLFLASPLSGFITGEIVDMNGGFQMD